jgi:secreted trypsin-like serine protease
MKSNSFFILSLLLGDLIFFPTQFTAYAQPFPKQTSCGQRVFNNTINRIINGKNAPNSWPWMVSLRQRIGSLILSHFCGGSLIYSNYVITAAHCVRDVRPENLAVVVGTNSLNETLSSSNVHFVTKIIYHQMFDEISLTNDIAILKLERNVRLSSSINTICLPDSVDEGNFVQNKFVTVIGWGSVTPSLQSPKLPENLQQANMRVINGNRLCDIGNYNPEKKYCLLDRLSNRASNVCSGDSGGPVFTLKENRWVLFGLVSYVIGLRNRCINALPSFATKVPAYIEWIGKAVNDTTD